MEKAEETLKVVVPEEDLYESSSESDQESGIANESESGIGSLNLEGVEDVAGRRLEDEEEHIWLTEEQKHIFDEIKRKEKERKMEEELSMKLILEITSRDSQVSAAAAPLAPSQNQFVKFPSQHMERGMTGEKAKVDEVLGWQEVKRSGRGESLGRNMNWPPLETSESSFKGLSSSGNQRAGGLRGIGQDMSKSESKWLKSNYKTVLCEFWNSTGRCQYGPGCHFAHGESELKRGKEVNCGGQQRQQQRPKKEGRVAGGGAALKSEEQRRAADKVSDYCSLKQ